MYMLAWDFPGLYSLLVKPSKEVQSCCGEWSNAGRSSRDVYWSRINRIGDREPVTAEMAGESDTQRKGLPT
jgi:hypothetical protein